MITIVFEFALFLMHERTLHCHAVVPLHSGRVVGNSETRELWGDCVKAASDSSQNGSDQVTNSQAVGCNLAAEFRTQLAHHSVLSPEWPSSGHNREANFSDWG